MIRTVLLSTAAVAAFAGSVLAADLPSRRAPPVYAPPPPIPVFTWTGFYVGAHAGYGFGNSNGLALATANGAPLAGGSGKPSGVIGGAHIGYNFSTQSLPVVGSTLGGALGAGGVFGIEGDVDGSNMRSTYGIGPLADYNRKPIQGSVRGRLGVAVDRALFYATGGVAFADIRNSYALGGFYNSMSHTSVGYTVGGGIEYSVTNNVSVRAEYRYTDFARYQDVLGPITVRHHDTDNRVQAGVSYRFDTFAAPVVARY